MKKLITRRRMLHGTGCALALPPLLSLRNLPGVTAAETDAVSSPQEQENPRRFCCIFFPNGVSLPPEEHPDFEDWHWFPHETGDRYQFTRTLEPLAAYRDQLSILSGLSHPSMRSSIAHITADSFLTGADSSRTYTNSISLDQMIAKHTGHQTRFASLALSSDGGVGAPGRTHTLSFSASGRPIPSLSEPRAIYNKLFSVSKRSKAQQRRAFGVDRSILDNVLEETTTLRNGLAQADRMILDEYTNSVREVEQRLASADQWLDAQQPVVDATGINLDADQEGQAEEYIRSILDLMYLAILSDSTCAITYQITSEDAKGIGDRFPVSLGLPSHHALSHGTADEDGYRQWATYDRFLAKQLAYFVDRLATTSDPLQDGSLLDNTLVLYGGSTSRTHQAVNYPLILAGGARLGLQHGAHRYFDESEYRLSDLYVTILQKMGLPLTQFADSTRSLSDIIG